MFGQRKDIKVLTGNSNPELANAICKKLGINLGNSEVGSFSDGRTSSPSMRPSGARTLL